MTVRGPFLVAVSSSLALILMGCSAGEPPAGPPGAEEQPENQTTSDAVEEAEKAATETPPLEELPVWTSDAAEEPKLADEAALGDYRLRPPLGYGLNQQAAGTNRMFVWKGGQREDGTAPNFTVQMGRLAPEDQQHTLQDLLGRSLGHLRQQRQNWTQSRPEHGQIDGVAFVRARWSGTSIPAQPAEATEHEMHGLIYFAVLEGNFIQMLFQDAAPHYQSSLSLGEAAALTFRRQATVSENPQP